MTALVIWCGPVSTSNLDGVAWPAGTELLTLSCNPPSDLHCPDLAASLGPHPISQLIAEHGLATPDRIAILGFSAGHAVLEHILSSEDAPLVSALGAFDAYFTGPGAPIKPGYLAFCQRAALGDALAVVTTSANSGLLPDGTPYPAGDVAFQRVADAVGGLSFVSPPAGVVPPVTCEGRGGLWWADYQGQGGTTHTIHATEYARAWNSALIAPYLAGATSGKVASSPLRKILKGAGFALGAFALGVATWKAVAER